MAGVGGRGGNGTVTQTVQCPPEQQYTTYPTQWSRSDDSAVQMGGFLVFFGNVRVALLCATNGHKTMEITILKAG